MTDVQKRNTSKSVLFGVGFENGRKVSIGASRKGRIWSFATANVASLTKWCSAVGSKILNEAIDPDEILKGTLESKIVAERPRRMPIGIDWPEDVYKQSETAHTFVLGDKTEIRLFEADIALKDPSEDGEIRFEIASATASIEVSLGLFEREDSKDFCFSVAGDKRVVVKYGSRFVTLTDFFHQYPPVIWFVDGSSLEGNKYTPLKTKYPPYDSQKIQAWNWTGTDLTKEAQGLAKEADSIQFRVIEELKKQHFDIIFDDDDKGEAADIVTIRLVEETEGRKVIAVEFYHCKYTKAQPGKRIKDLFEVCGQAQKSIHWMESHEKQVELFTHLLRREHMRTDRQQPSRFERGWRDDLIKLREMSYVYPVQLKIFIVQPGLSKTSATKDQLELLSVTENHLLETYNLPFGIIASQ